MPAKNSQKYYVKDGYYHIYNRGVENIAIFRDQQDYEVFLSFLETYLTPQDPTLKEKLTDPSLTSTEKQQILKQLNMNNFHDEITMLAFVLMPDHFHFFIKQKKRTSLNSFMNSLCTRYAMYFNRKYKRTGHLFQGVYKAVLIEHESYFVPLATYIHKNPLSLSDEDALTTQPSSYPHYLGHHQNSWVKPEEIQSLFLKTNSALSYEQFVKETEDFSLIEDEKIDEHDWIVSEINIRPPLEEPKKQGFLRRLFDI